MDYKKLAEAALEARAKLVAEIRTIEASDKTDAEKREIVERMDVDVAAYEAEARSMVEQGERESEIRSIAARAGLIVMPGTTPVDVDPDGDLADSFRALARGEIRDLSFDMRTALSSVAGNAGNTKPTTFVAQVIEAMRFRSPFLGLVKTFTTSGGETLEFPVKGARPAGVQIAENTAYTKVDESWTKANLGAWKYGVIAEATQEIIDDSALPILDILSTDIGEAIADKVVADLLVGVGTTKPWGFITRSAGAVNAANLAGVTTDNLMDLQYALTVPYRRNAVYIMSDNLGAVVRKLKDTTGRYLWEPSLVAGAPDRLLGYPVVTDPNVAIAGASAKVAVFGDPSKYLVRQVKDVKVVRSDEYGFDRDVVAFKANWRGDGDLLDVAASKALTVTA